MDSLTLAFEPWSLGDAVIAARVARERPGSAVLVAPRWTETLKVLWPGLELRTVDLAYTLKGQGRTWKDALKTIVPDREFSGEVVSIRGDVRDRRVARQMYPRAQFRFSGLAAFAARHSRLINVPFRLGLWPVMNRYARWANALGVTLPEFDFSPPARPVRRILVHMGAQWLSKRYPWPVPLRDLLRSRGFHVDLALGPGDSPIEGTNPKDVLTLSGRELVGFMRERTDLVLCNDSAPMHIAAANEKPAGVFTALTDIREWRPPGRVLLFERRPHCGYGASPHYMSDRLLANEAFWNTPEEILSRLETSRWLV